MGKQRNKSPVKCSLTNKKGTWQDEAPGMVSVRRSDDPLRVAFQVGEKHWQGVIEGQRGGRAWGYGPDDAGDGGKVKGNRVHIGECTAPFDSDTVLTVPGESVPRRWYRRWKDPDTR